ncbi:hypothetical protein AC579_8970 [Pseudocercospora musae]|uniref:Uncharacterized protein n=1 Tax=Pseudocercospora musae TaxID=113226 RepID=A0A139HP10_9PEZI|nr:hypothetical protein AC579_8970 [Pseudocercospora musae]
MLPRSEREDIDGDGDMPSNQFPRDDLHANVKAGKQYKGYHCNDILLLPTRNDSSALRAAYQTEFSKANVNTTNPCTIDWYNTLAFDDPQTQRRAVLKNCDFVQYCDSGELGRIDYIFSHQESAVSSREVFVRIQTTTKVGDPLDPLTQLPLYRLDDQKVVVGLPGIRSNKIWMITVYRNGLEMKRVLKPLGGNKASTCLQSSHCAEEIVTRQSNTLPSFHVWLRNTLFSTSISRLNLFSKRNPSSKHSLSTSSNTSSTSFGICDRATLQHFQTTSDGLWVWIVDSIGTVQGAMTAGSGRFLKRAVISRFNY